MTTSTQSGISAYVHTNTSITIQYTNGSVYRYDVSEVLSKTQLKEMIALAKQGKGLNSFLNRNPQIKKYGYIDTTLNKSSFKSY